MTRFQPTRTEQAAAPALAASVSVPERLGLAGFHITRIPGIEPGSMVRVTGAVGECKGHLALADPRYESLLPCDTKAR